MEYSQSTSKERFSKIYDLLDEVKRDGLSKQMNWDAIIWCVTVVTASSLVNMAARDNVTL